MSSPDAGRADAARPLPVSWPEGLVASAVVAASVVLRFVAPTPLWLDEALTVNIASLPLGDIGEALRRDGHPPLFYVLLHGWMELFGQSDAAVRSLAGVFSVLTLPLAWIAGGRRAGRPGAWAVLLVVAITPFDLRYATEARMYSLVMLLVLAGYLLAEDLLGRVVAWKVAALSLITGALLWTHYWSIWLGAVAAALLVVRAARHRGGARRRAFVVIGALGAGAVMFVPWLPSLVHQAGSTGTPWALPATPTRAAQDLLFALGGGGHPEPLVFSVLLVLLVAVGLLARPVRGSTRRMELDLRTVPGARGEALLVLGTLVAGLVMGYATHSTFAPRYAATVVPLLLVVAALGLSRLPGRPPRRLVGGLFVVLAVAGAARLLTEDRTQAGELAGAVDAAAGPGDLVVYCPDQLGPAVDRELQAPLEQVVFPSFAGPQRVDWSDYEERHEAADVEAFARQALERAGDDTLWLVWSSDYRTVEEDCPALLTALAGAREGREVVPSGGEEYFEHAALWRFDATGSATS